MYQKVEDEDWMEGETNIFNLTMLLGNIEMMGIKNNWIDKSSLGEEKKLSCKSYSITH